MLNLLNLIFMNNFGIVLIGLIMLTLAVLIADRLIGEREIQIRDALETQEIAERIRPLGKINIIPQLPKINPTNIPAIRYIIPINNPSTIASMYLTL